MNTKRLPLRDVIVVLPGIMGSTLTREGGGDLWGTSLSAIWGIVNSFGRSVDDLALPGDDGADDEKASDGIGSTSLIRDLHGLPGLTLVDGYTRLCDRIRETFEVTPGENFIEFHYDWRRDNRRHARRLQKQSAEWLERARSKDKDARLVLIAHSMGGVIARYFTEKLGGWKDTRALLTFGTPFLGAAKVLSTVADGARLSLFGPISKASPTATLRTFPSIYQLLPVYKSVAVDDVAVYDPTKRLYLAHQSERRLNLEACGLDVDKVIEGRAFHREIREATVTNLKNADYTESNYRQRSVVGHHQPTVQAVRWRDGKLEVIEEDEGDGSVPHASAMLEGFGSNYQSAPITELHGSIQNADQAFLELEHLLASTGNGSGPEPFSGDAKEVGFRCEDAYPAQEPFTLQARPIDADVALVATVTGPGSESLSLPFQPGANRWHAAAVPALSAGVYRVAVSGAGTDTVHGVFVAMATG